MKIQTLAFCTTTDSNYYEPLLVAVKQALKFYPDSPYYIYDWGLTEHQKSSLTTFENVRIIDWPLKFIEIELDLDKKTLLKTLLGSPNMKSFGYNLLLKREGLWNENNLINLYKFGVRMHNKLLCVDDLLTRTDARIAVMDADAFLINPIDELLEDSFDIGATLRRAEEISYEYNRCTVLNGGVVFLFGKPETNKHFVKEWLKVLDSTKELYFEQTALTRMFYDKKPDVFEKAEVTHSIEIGGQKIRTKILPCEIYNYNWIEEFDPKNDKNRVKILHFKSGRFNTPLFKKIAEELSL